MSIINGAGVGTLHDLLALLDEEIRRITLQIKENGHPEINGLADRSEYFIGIGFVAIQQFLVESIMFSNLSKVEAYKLGPIHSSGISYANLINSCANWWKHEPEWWSGPEEEARGKHSISNVLEITSSPSYQLSNVLASICGSNELCFQAIIPFLIEWRAAVSKEKKSNL